MFPDNTNTMELFQPGNNIGTTTNEFADAPLPDILLSVDRRLYEGFNKTAELAPFRLADLVTNPPPSFLTAITQTNGIPALAWGPDAAWFDL